MDVAAAAGQCDVDASGLDERACVAAGEDLAHGLLAHQIQNTVQSLGQALLHVRALHNPGRRALFDAEQLALAGFVDEVAAQATDSLG